MGILGKTNYELFNAILGKDIKTIKRIKSIVNKDETVPSLFFYYNNYIKDWLFKDFSSGVHGGPVYFLMLRDNISREEAIEKLKKLIGYNENENKIVPPPPAVEHNLSYEYHFNIVFNEDKLISYFASLYVPKKLLRQNNVFMLNDFKKVIRNKEGKIISVKNIFKECIGYFDTYGELIQCYVPKEWSLTGKKEFFNVTPMKYMYRDNNSKILIITKSVKDFIVWQSITDNKYDIFSLMSETYKVDKDIIILSAKKGYIRKICILDNDDSGKRAAKALQIPDKEILFTPEKDISDSLMKYSLEYIKEYFKEYDLNIETNVKLD